MPNKDRTVTWKELGISDENVSEHKADPNRPFYLEDPPEDLVNRTVETLTETGRKRRERVQELRKLGLPKVLVEEILHLDDSGINFTQISDEKFKTIVAKSIERAKKMAKERLNKVYTEEEILEIEKRHGLRKIVEKHNRKVLRTHWWKRFFKNIEDYLALMLVFIMILLFLLNVVLLCITSSH